MIRNALLALALVSSIPLLSAQSTQAELQARLLHKPLYLLGRWQDDHLKFDPTGQLRSKSDMGSFTTSGIDIQSVDLGTKGLSVRGTRVGLVFREGAVERTGIGEGNTPGGHAETIVIQIAPPADGLYGPALDAVFTGDLSKFIPSLPEFWQTYAQEHLLHPRAEVAMTDDADGPPEPGERFNKPVPAPGTRRIGGGVTAPRVLNAPEPQYSRQARSTGLSGNVLVYLWVDTMGNPTHIRLLRPVGLGLDEKAVEAVSRYKFKPAQQNGTPVTVEMNVEVNFQVF